MSSATHPSLSTSTIAKRLCAAMARVEQDGAAAIDDLTELYAPALRFVDPLQTLTGRDAFLEMNRRIARRARKLRFQIHDVSSDAEQIFTTWTMTLAFRLSPTMIFEGVTHAQVRDGQIVMQRDYWDLSSAVAGSVPILRALYPRLAARLG